MRLICILLFAAIAASAQPPHSVTLNWAWSAGTGGTASGFNIKRATISGGPYVLIGTVATTATTTYVDTSATGNLLAEGSKYFYIVTATGPGGESAPSSEANALIPFSAPASPTAVTAIPK